MHQPPVLCRWFARDEDDGQIERELLPSFTGGVNWRLVVVTGQERGAGTDADVFVELFGEFGATSVTLEGKGRRVGVLGWGRSATGAPTQMHSMSCSSGETQQCKGQVVQCEGQAYMSVNCCGSHTFAAGSLQAAPRCIG